MLGRGDREQNFTANYTWSKLITLIRERVIPATKRQRLCAHIRGGCAIKVR
jgi:hypothetical protein